MGQKDDYLRLLDRRLAPLAFDRVVAFCCCCCERMTPSYKAHFDGEMRGDRDVVDPALTCLWSTFDGIALDHDDARQLLVACQQISFATDNETAFAPQAETALNGVMSTLKYFIERTTSDARSVAQYGSRSIVEWVDFTSAYYLGDYGYEMDDAPLFRLRCVPVPALLSTEFHHARDDEYDSWLQAHPMVVAERSKQLLDLAILAAVPSLTPEIVKMMRESSRTKGVQPYLRGLAARR